MALASPSSYEPTIDPEPEPQEAPVSMASSQAHFISHEPVQAHQVAHLSLPSHAVMTRARRAVEPVEEQETTERSEGSPHFSELDDLIHKVRKSTKGINATVPATSPITLATSSSEGEEEPPQGEPTTSPWQGPPIPEEDRIQGGKTTQPGFVAYDIWADLQSMKANISVAQLLHLVPSAKAVLRRKISVTKRLRKKPQVAARVNVARYPTGRIGEVQAVEIEATIVDKVLPRVLVDGGSGVNIMPVHTMEQLGLQITGPSPYVINMANHISEAPMGQITGCRMYAGGEVYTMTFQVLKMHTNRDSFSLLLGRPWLRATNATVNWGGNKPHIIYGPEANPTRVYIQPCFPSSKSEAESSSEGEDHIPRRVRKTTKEVKFVFPELQRSEPASPLSCLGPGLYEWEDDGEFATWLVEQPDIDLGQRIDAYYTEELGYEAGKCVDLAALVDDISHEDVYGVTLDGTQPPEVNTFIAEETLVGPLRFKTTSTGI